MRESHIEGEVCKRARELGWVVWKLVVLNVVGVPDRLFLKEGDVFFIEFKAPGRKPAPHQERVHRLLRKHRFDVYVVDDIDHGVDLVEART